MGFTGSTGSSRKGTITITSWNLKTVTLEDTFTNWRSDKYASPKIILANSRERASFIIGNLDACNNTVEYGGFSKRITAKFTDIHDSQRAPIPAIVTDNSDGTYSLALETSIVSNFSLEVTFGQDCNKTSPHCWSDSIPLAVRTLPVPIIVPTEPPVEQGLPSDALTGVGIGVGVFLGVSSILGIFL